MRNSIGHALLLAALLIAPSAAQASSKCQCDNGKTLTIDSSDEDACQSACDLRGGGHAWSPEDQQGDEPAAAAPTTRQRGSAKTPVASTGSGSEDPHNRP